MSKREASDAEMWAALIGLAICIFVCGAFVGKVFKDGAQLALIIPAALIGLLLIGYELGRRYERERDADKDSQAEPAQPPGQTSEPTDSTE